MRRRGTMLWTSWCLAACTTDHRPSPQIAADRMQFSAMTTATALDPRDPPALARLIHDDLVRGVTATYRLVAPVENAVAAQRQFDAAAREGHATVTLEWTTDGTLHVDVTRLSVSVPDCPDWSRRSDDDFSNRPSSNFGCADAVDLAAQVANPADLIAGQRRAGEPARALAAAVAQVAADRAKPLKAAAAPAQGGPISDDPRQ